MEKKYGYYWSKPNNGFEQFIENLEEVFQWIYNHSINLYLDRKKRKIKIKMHNYDSWNAFHTLALVILPVLKQVQADKEDGSPLVDDEDAVPELSSKNCVKKNEWDWDENVHKRWEYVLGEIIWSFEQIVDESSDDRFFDVDGGNFDRVGFDKWYARKQNGLRLFGKYFENLWT